MLTKLKKILVFENTFKTINKDIQTTVCDFTPQVLCMTLSIASWTQYSPLNIEHPLVNCDSDREQ